jgi:uncharacterized protein (TIGR03067 family)
MKAMAKDPAARFASMKEFASAVDAVLRAPAGSSASTGKVDKTQTDGDSSMGTDTRRLADLFAAYSAERKQETEAVIERAVRNARTPRWVFLLFGLLLLGGLTALGGIVFYAKTKSATVLIDVNVDLSDKTLSFFLDGKPISAEELSKPVELKVGEHELIVKRGKDVVKRMLFGVRGGWNPSIEITEVDEPPPLDDLKRLEGEWEVEAEEYHGVKTPDDDIREMRKTITIAGDYMNIERTMRNGQRLKIDGRIRLDPNVNPKTWDFTGKHFRGDSVVFRGLYEVDGDRLRLVYDQAAADEDQPARPTGFRTLPMTEIVLISAKRRPRQLGAPEAGFFPLFNGKDLTGWETHSAQPGNWRAKDGILIGSGEGSNVSHLYTKRDDYRDFHLRMEARLISGGSSGVYCRAPFGPTFPAKNPLWLPGYNAKLDKNRLGGLIVDGEPGRPLLRDQEPQFQFGQWITFELIVRGHHIQIKVDGKTTVDYEDRDQRYNKGRIALQQHGSPMLVEFRRIEIKEFAPPNDLGFGPLFNGKDLTGWVNVNTDPGTFLAKNGEIVTTGNPFGFLRTEKQYENFELELDWMHVEKVEKANSGLFIWCDGLPAEGKPFPRAFEVQILVNMEARDKKTNAVTATSHGDIIASYGAKCTPERPHPLGWERCLPSENRAKGGGEWNHYNVIAKNGAIKLEVNGKEVSGVHSCTPSKGYIALQSEGSECHFKNLRIKELGQPPALPLPAPEAGFVPLFNGKDLTGWESTHPESFSVDADGHILTAGDTPGSLQWLMTKKDYSNFVLRFEFQFLRTLPTHTNSGVTFRAVTGKTGANGAKLRVELRNDPKLRPQTGAIVYAAGEYWVDPKDPPPIKPPGDWNTTEIEAIGSRVRVTVNGQLVNDVDLSKIDRSKVDIKEKGPAEADLDRSAGRIGLQSFRGQTKFRNIQVKELK